MISDATVERILRVAAPGVRVNLSALQMLDRESPRPASFLALLASSDVETVRAAVLYIGLYGSLRECPVLALCLQHKDDTVARLAEYCLWSIWMQSGSDEGNRRLAQGVTHLKDADYFAAIPILESLCEDEPAFAEAHFQYALALSSVDNLDEAADELHAVLRLNPYHFAAAATLGHTYTEQGEVASALRCYRQALRIHPRLDDVRATIDEINALVAEHRGSAS